MDAVGTASHVANALAISVWNCEAVTPGTPRFGRKPANARRIPFERRWRRSDRERQVEVGLRRLAR